MKPEKKVAASMVLDENTFVVKVGAEKKWCEQAWESLVWRPFKWARRWAESVLDKEPCVNLFDTFTCGRFQG